ncbi:MAG: CPBP family intramembrane metalloprotease [Planctomycetes bacterium]|nr:CPBP family intramembrane metalloprotease [Planctomycetota bacterium]
MNETPDGEAPASTLLGAWYATLARVGRLTRKELREILRDRRTIVTLIAMPLLLYPLMAVLFLQFSLPASLQKPASDYKVGMLSKAEADVFHERLEQGRRALARKRAAAKADGRKADPPELPSIQAVWEEREPKNDSERAEAAERMIQRLHDGLLPLFIVLPNVQGNAKPGASRWSACRIYSLSNSAAAQDAVPVIELLLTAANEDDLKARLPAKGLAPITMLSVELVSVRVETRENLLASLVPLILILMTITGAVYPAIDLTAGERERGTLEILVAAPVSRFELLTAKYFSVVTVAVLNAVVNLLFMTVTVKFSGVNVPGLQELSLPLLLEMFGLLLVFASFFSAVLLCLTSFARSFKEAQAYLIPLMLASLGPGIMAMMPGLKLTGVMTVLPLVNIVLMARDLFDTGVDPVQGTIAVLTTGLYALAARVFGAESVLYSEQSSWSDLLRRPDEPQATASIPSMLWCLALMVPIQFALFALVRGMGAMPPLASIALNVAINLLLFGVLPAIFVSVGRVTMFTGLGLSLPRPAALLGGFLLGVSLWPIELWLLQWSVDARLLEERLGPVLEGYRSARENVGWLVLALAVVPAVLEELFFRGLLFNALKARSGAVVTIGVSSVLFGITHFVLGGALGLERFAPSAILGLILGTVCWRSGSVWPSMILHVGHNAILLGLAPKEAPLVWLAFACPVAALGGLIVWWSGRTNDAATTA